MYFFLNSTLIFWRVATQMNTVRPLQEKAEKIMAMSLISQHITTKSLYLVSMISIMITISIMISIMRMIINVAVALYGIVPLNICCIWLWLYVMLEQNDWEAFSDIYKIVVGMYAAVPRTRIALILVFKTGGRNRIFIPVYGSASFSVLLPLCLF